MTTLHMQSQDHITCLTFPSSADMMELSSDVERRVEPEEDVDLDLDLTGVNEQDEEDAYMNEGTNVMINDALTDEQDMHTGNDDEMVEDGYIERTIIEDHSVIDENIEDADYPRTEMEKQLDHFNDSHLPEDPSLDVQRADVGNGNGEQEYVETRTQGTTEVYLDNAQPQGEEQGQELDANEGQGSSSNELQGSHELDSSAFENGVTDSYGDLEDKDDVISNQTAQNHNQTDFEGYEREENALSRSSHDEPETNIEVLERPIYDIPEARDQKYDRPAVDTVLDAGISEEQVTIKEVTERRNQQDSDFPEEANVVDNRGSTSGLANTIDPADTNFPKDLIRIHPVLVAYQENEISLFPPIDRYDEDEEESTYFLRDEHLANDTIGHLLAELRSVLGGSVGEHEELSIEVEDLDLQLCESTPECTTISLSHIIDIYVNLQACDGIEEPPPLYVNLTTKNRFAHRLDFLASVIAEGKGLSYVRSNLQPQEAEGPTQLTPQRTPNLPVEHNIESGPDNHEAEDSFASTNETMTVSGNDRPPLSSPIQTSDAVPQVLEKASSSEVPILETDYKDPDLNNSEGEVIYDQANGHQAEYHQSPGEGDFLEYEDDEELANEESNESSRFHVDDILKQNDSAVSEGFLSGKGEAAQTATTQSTSPLIESVGSTLNNRIEEDTRSKTMVEEGSDAVEYLPTDPKYPHASDASPLDSPSQKHFHLTESVKQDDPLSLDTTSAHLQVSQAKADHGQMIDHEVTAEISGAKLENGHNLLLNQTSRDHRAISSDSNTNEQDSGIGGSANDNGQSDAQGKNETPYPDKEEEDISVPNKPSGPAHTSTSDIDPPADEQLDEDEDEITFNDEDDEEEESSHQRVPNETALDLSPTSHKRGRSLCDHDAEVDDDSQGSKRIRSH